MSIRVGSVTHQATKMLRPKMFSQKQRLEGSSQSLSATPHWHQLWAINQAPSSGTTAAHFGQCQQQEEEDAQSTVPGETSRTELAPVRTRACSRDTTPSLASYDSGVWLEDVGWKRTIEKAADKPVQVLDSPVLCLVAGQLRGSHERDGQDKPAASPSRDACSLFSELELATGLHSPSRQFLLEY